MPLDAVTLSGVINEANDKLIGARIDKIHQPERDEIILHIRGMGFSKKLLLSANPATPRMHMVQDTMENPAVPPMFCMLLRKHLQSARICSITQPSMERMAIIEFDSTDEMGVPCKKYLCHEIMSRQSNIILYDEEMRIIDSIKRVEGDISAKRRILPGLFYRMPPTQDKINPCTVSKQGLIAAILKADEQMPADKWILSTFYGFSPLLCREIASKATGHTDLLMSDMSADQKNAFAEVFTSLIEKTMGKGLSPTLLVKKESGEVFDFTVMDSTQYGNEIENQSFDSFSELLERYYSKKSRNDKIKRRSMDMTKTVQNALDRARRKLLLQEEELIKTGERDKFKRKGDIITANLYQIEEGATKVKLIDYYSEDCKEVEITLKSELSPQNNAQRYYKLYNKAKTAEKFLTEQIALGKIDINYLQSVISSIETAQTETDLSQIREELISTGYLSPLRGSKNKKNKPVANKPYEYITRDGFSVFAGKNNTQNDMLTFKTAFKSDMWFHVQTFHGSHVILVCDGKEPTLEALNDAAMIAAYHTSGKGLAKIPVDYTQIRNIKKPPAGKLGMVIYHVYNTAYVTPDEKLVESMRVK